MRRSLTHRAASVPRKQSVTIASPSTAQSFGFRCMVRITASDPRGFTPEELLLRLHEATFANLREAYHVYPVSFQLEGATSDDGVPIVRMRCGS